MILITQLVYLIEGQEETFDKFESMAIPLIAKHNGTCLLRIRPAENNFIESQIGNPYEVHLVEFSTAEDFDNFMQDEERRTFLHLKAQSIKASILIQGARL